MIHERAELPRNRGANSRDRRIMQYAYQEWMSPHAIVGMMIATVCVLGGFVFIGPMGTYDAFTPLQRLGFGSLCAFFGAPIFFAMDVVTLYFMRFRSALEVGLAVTMAALFVALPCAAVISTVETLVHADYSADAGLLRGYILAATLGVACSLLFLYVVYQRIKRTAGLAMPAAGGSGALAVAAGEGNEATADAAASADPLPDAGGTDNVTGQLDVQRGADEAEDDGAGSPEPARLRSNGTPPMAPAATESEESDPSGAPPKTEAPSGTGAVDGSQQLTAERGDGEPARRVPGTTAPQAGHRPYLSQERGPLRRSPYQRRLHPHQDALRGRGRGARRIRNPGAPQLLGRYAPRATIGEER